MILSHRQQCSPSSSSAFQPPHIGHLFIFFTTLARLFGQAQLGKGLSLPELRRWPAQSLRLVRGCLAYYNTGRLWRAVLPHGSPLCTKRGKMPVRFQKLVPGLSPRVLPLATGPGDPTWDVRSYS